MNYITNCLITFADAMIGGLIVTICILIAGTVCMGMNYLLNRHDGYRNLRKMQKESRLENVKLDD